MGMDAMDRHGWLGWAQMALMVCMGVDGYGWHRWAWVAQTGTDVCG